MAQRNDENTAVAMVAAGIIIVALAFAAIIAAALVFVTIVFTIHALFAWKKPVTFWGNTIFPEEAQAFVYRGMIGASVAFFIALISVKAFDLKHESAVLLISMISGYLFSSLGLEAMKSGKTPDGAPDIFPERAIPLPPEVRIGPVIDVTPAKDEPTPEAKTFAFADWNDEKAKP